MDAAIKARFAAMENDPILRRKRDARELRNRFDIGYVDQEQYPRVTVSGGAALAINQFHKAALSREHLH